MSPVDRPLRLGVLLSGTGRTLENLLHWQDNGTLAARVTCVASNRGAVRGLQIAEEAGVPSSSFRLSAHADRVQRDRAMADWVLGHDCDLVVLAGYLALLDTTAFAGLPILNIHPALLPRHGGEGCWGHHVHEAVLADGDEESGCSVHLVDGEFDHGRVLAQWRVPVLSDDTPDSLAARVFEAECELYPETINRIANGELDPGAGRAEGTDA
ncbi:phosphoribosylglycinamide formyltransferase [bacterium]|nr:MAG: phosphoribosylglycinamide formyltransferase [bacterium]